MVTRTLLATHAELDREEPASSIPGELRQKGASLKSNPRHIVKGAEEIEGKEKIRRIASMTIQRIQEDVDGGGITMAISGEAQKYEDIQVEFAIQTRSLYPFMVRKWAWLLGGPTALHTKWGKATSIGRAIYDSKNYIPAYKYVPPEIFWKLVQDLDEEAGGYKIFCAGRQFMTSLGEHFRAQFTIASVYEMDWRTRELRCIIKNAEWV